MTSPDKPLTIKRRSLLRGALAISLAELAGCDNSPTLLPNSEQIKLLKVKQGSPNLGQLESGFANRLQSLLMTLQASRATPAVRVEAVKNARRQVLISRLAQLAVGTALELDQSGLYLTAKHLIPPEYVGKNSHYFSNTIITVNNPYTGESNYARGFWLHPSADIGIIYAPSGKPPTPTPNLAIKASARTDSQKLWMVALMPIIGKTDTTDEAVLPGRVAGEEKGRMLIEGMIPRGGTSGSPIIDQEGCVTAVESGFYPLTENFQKYRGATAVPVGKALELAKIVPYSY